ncbi:hypothetical protein [Sessilibacter corallicola]|uniref:Uncharacterized protein n=1 Tax=Sessilibacter corallicola TaxID=2904075 RepID=A0ABQ0A9H3_9GAMM
MGTEKYTREEIEQLEDRSDKERLKNMTDEEIEEAAKSDPDNPPLSEDQLKSFKRPSEEYRKRFQKK